MQKQKLGIIVPYRDREDHLKYFVPSIKEYLDECGIPHSIYIIEQGNEKSFNRGKLLNVGYELFKDDCDKNKSGMPIYDDKKRLVGIFSKREDNIDTLRKIEELPDDIKQGIIDINQKGIDGQKKVVELLKKKL